MDNQQAADAQAPVDNDAPLLNTQAPAEAPEAAQEAPIPLHDDSEQEQQQFTTDVDDEPLERPDFYPEKFWDEDGPDVEKLARSYAELEKQFKAGDHKAPEGDYDVANLVDKGLDLEDPTVVTFQEWSKEYGISQAAFDDLASRVLSISQSDAENMEMDRQTEMNKLGERAQEKIAMAERLLIKAPLNEDERDAISYSLNNADAINAFLKYHASITNEGIPVNAAVATSSMSRADLEAAIADPRWTTDPLFRTKIEQQWMESNN